MDEAFYRDYDPQIGRFLQIDPKVESAEAWSVYSGMLDNPILHSDPLGDSSAKPWPLRVNKEQNSTPQLPIGIQDNKQKKTNTDGTPSGTNNGSPKKPGEKSNPGSQRPSGGNNEKPLSGSTITTKSTVDYTLLNSGVGDELKASVYTGTVVGQEGWLITSDASTSNGKPEGASVTIAGVLTLGYGNDKSVSIGVGAFGYEGHVGIGVGNGLGQVSAGGSHTANGVISGGDETFKAGGVAATAIITTAIIMSGGLGALAF